MSWKQVIPGGPQRSTIGLAMAYRLGHGKHGKPQYFVYFGHDVMEVLRWTIGQQVGVYFGSGEHANKLRIAPAVNGTIKVRNVGGSVKKLGVCFQAPPGRTPPEVHFSMPVNHEVVSDGVEIALPSWARHQEAKTIYRDVSGALMGDPRRPALVKG